MNQYSVAIATTEADGNTWPDLAGKKPKEKTWYFVDNKQGVTIGKFKNLLTAMKLTNSAPDLTLRAYVADEKTISKEERQRQAYIMEQLHEDYQQCKSDIHKRRNP